MDEALQQALRMRMQERHDETLITFLHRAGGMQAYPMTGGALLAAAQRQGAVWRDVFGAGRYVLALSLPHGAHFVTALLAGLLSGIRIVALPPTKPGDVRLAHIVKDSGARAVICEHERADALCRSLKQTGPLPCPVHAPDGTLLHDGPSPSHDLQLHGDTVLLQYTSGSTRMPKGVEMSGANILANSALVERGWGMGTDTVTINWMPHYHDMGLMGCLLFPILFGGVSVQMSPFDAIRAPISWLKAVQDFKGTTTGGPAFIYGECLKRITPEDCEGLDLSTLEHLFCGSEPVPADLLPAMQTRFEPFGLRKNISFSCYGMAENTLFVAGGPTDNPTKATHELAPCHLTPETRETLCIAGPDMARLPDGEEGEICVKGPSQSRGYLNLVEETADTFVEAEGATWLRTGDLGRIDGDDLFITGRRKDMLIVHGRNVAATEVEWLAAGLDAVLNRHAAATFSPDISAPADAVLLIEVLHKARDLPQADDLRTHIARAVRGALGVNLTDIRFLPRGTLDKTSSGKVRRAVIAQAYRAGDMHAGLRTPIKAQAT